MRRHRRAKIVATLGPSSTDEATVRALFETGVDVFRLNFSHGTHAEHSARHALLRAIEAETGRPIGILADLQGPKLRIGTFRSGEASLAQGQRFTLSLGDAPGDETGVGVPHAEIFAALAPGADVLLDDGRVRLRVAACGPDHAETVVVTPGVLSDRKGLNLPGVTLPIDAVTAKDREDLAFALGLGIDWVALSFVQGPGDIASARRLVPEGVAIVAKLEKPSGARLPGGDRRSLRRDHDGARRPRRGACARGRAGGAEAHRPRGADRREAGGDRDPDAGFDDRTRRRPRAPKPPMSRPRSTTAPMRSCSPANPPPGAIRSRRWR